MQNHQLLLVAAVEFAFRQNTSLNTSNVSGCFEIIFHCWIDLMNAQYFS